MYDVQNRHYRDVHVEVSSGQGNPSRREACRPSQAWSLELTPRGGHGRGFRRSRFLRSARFGASEVRNGSPRAYRRAIDRERCDGLWVFTPIVLSGPSFSRGVRVSRALTSPSWASRRAQAPRRGAGLHRVCVGRGSLATAARCGPTGQRPIWPIATPAEYRTWAGTASKKTTAPGSPIAPPISNRDLTARYEALRAQYVEEGYAAGPSLGLSLPMGQGMASWLKSSPSLPASSVSTTSPPLAPGPDASLDTLRSEAAMVLASMISDIDRRVLACT